MIEKRVTGATAKMKNENSFRQEVVLISVPEYLSYYTACGNLYEKDRLYLSNPAVPTPFIRRNRPSWSAGEAQQPDLSASMKI